MLSTSRHTPAFAVHILLFTTMAIIHGARALPSMTYVGCFSSSQPLKDLGSYTYQTSGYCQQQCTGKNQAVLGLSAGSDCWCGNETPATNTKVDDAKCNSPCNGFDQDTCGGDGYYQVYLTGTTDDVSSYGGSSGGSSSNSASASPTRVTASPSVVTSVSPGKTVVVTKAPSPSSSSSSHSGSGGSNTTAVAAGVVVGVVLAVSAAAAIFFWLRHRRRKAAEDEYNRTQISEFIRGGEGKPPPSGYSNMSDTRLDPEVGVRRNSHGSIADNEDFSRRILRVANPDRNSFRPARGET